MLNHKPISLSLAITVAFGLLLVASQASAYVGSGTVEHQAAAPVPATDSEPTVNLTPITVYGHKLYVPVMLQVIKNGLSRPMSTHRKDAHKLFCQWEYHGTVVVCQSNLYHWRYTRALQSMIHGQAPLPMGRKLVHFAIHANRTAMQKLLKKLPPAGSSYTLRITDHGKTVIKYVFKGGVLDSISKAKKQE